MLISQLSTLNKQLEALNEELADLRIKEQQIIDVLKINVGAQNQAQNDLDYATTQIENAKQDVTSQENALSDAKEDEELAKKEELEASNELIEAVDVSWDQQQITNALEAELLENSNLIILKSDFQGYSRAVHTDDENNYYVIEYYDPEDGTYAPEGCKRYLTEDETAQIQQQIDSGKTTVNNASDNDRRMNEEFMNQARIAEGLSNEADISGYKYDKAKESVVNTAACVLVEEEKLNELKNTLENVKNEWQPRIDAIQKDLESLKEKQQKLEQDLKENRASQQEIEQEIKALEERVEELKTQKEIYAHDIEQMEHMLETAEEGHVCYEDVSGTLHSRLTNVFNKNSDANGPGNESMFANADVESTNATDVADAEGLDTPEPVYDWEGETLGPKLRALENDILSNGIKVLDIDGLMTRAKGCGFTDAQISKLADKLQDDIPDLRIVDPRNMNYEYVVGDFKPRNPNASPGMASTAFGTAVGNTPPAPTAPTLPEPEKPKPVTLQQQFGMMT